MTTTHSALNFTARFLVLAAAVLLWFCIGTADASAASVVLTINGSASANVQAGSNVTLKWEAVGVTNCTINNGVGAVPNTGTRTVTAPSSGAVTYTIACSGAQSSTVTVSVKPYVDLYTTPAQASPDVAGGSADVTVNWNAVNATKCTKLTAKNNQTGVTRTLFTNANEPVSGKRSDKINGNTTYTLTCINAQNGQSDTESQTVTFVPFGPPQITTFTTNKGTTAPWSAQWAGVNLKVQFQSTNTNKCIRTAKDKNGNKYALQGWTAENLTGSGTDWVSGGFVTTITDTTTFELRCGRTSTNDWVTKTLLFTVTGVPPAGSTGASTTNPTAAIFAPDSVTVPQASNLPARVQVETKTQYANSCTFKAFNQAGTAITVNGWTNHHTTLNLNQSFDIFVNQTTKLELKCTRSTDGKSATANHTITVGVGGSGAVADLELDAVAIGPKNNVQQVRLNWTGENVSSCTKDDVIINGSRVDNWYKNGTIPLSGVTTASVFANTTYSLTCTNAVTGERVTDTVLVVLNSSGEAEIIEASAGLNTGGSGSTTPKVILKGNPNPSTGPGDSVVLTWDGTNVTSCTVTGGGINVSGGTDGNTTVAPNVDTTYTVNCTGPNGPANDSEMISVTPDNTPDVELTITDPSTGPGDNVVLTWDGTNVTSCTLTGPGVNVSGGADGSGNASPNNNTTYTVSCTGPNGPATDTEQVIVPNLNNLGNTMDLEADPIVVRKGDRTDLTWSADPSLTSQTSCVIQANGVAITGALTGAGGTIVSPPLNAETTFSLVCVGVTTPPAEATVRVRVLPTIEET